MGRSFERFWWTVLRLNLDVSCLELPDSWSEMRNKYWFVYWVLLGYFASDWKYMVYADNANLVLVWLWRKSLCIIVTLKPVPGTNQYWKMRVEFFYQGNNCQGSHCLFWSHANLFLEPTSTKQWGLLTSTDYYARLRVTSKKPLCSLCNKCYLKCLVI